MAFPGVKDVVRVPGAMFVLEVILENSACWTPYVAAS